MKTKEGAVNFRLKRRVARLKGGLLESGVPAGCEALSGPQRQPLTVLQVRRIEEMSLYTKLKGACVGLMIALACAGVGVAQESGRAEQQRDVGRMQREGRRGERGRGHKMMGMMRGLRELNLTEAQQQQVRAIMERFAEATRPQREALMQMREQREQGATGEQTSERAKQLRGEIREAMQRGRAEIAAILTPEQRARLEQMEQERKARHEERRQRMDDDQ
jgi:periplasmic protein CpxP/Spy